MLLALLILIFWIVVVIVGGIVAHNKGRSAVGWVLLCLLLTPLAILILFALPTLKPHEPQLVRVVQEADGTRRPCPFCAELILPAAKVCRFCARELPEAWASESLPEAAKQVGEPFGIGSRVMHESETYRGVGEVVAITGETTITVKFNDGVTEHHRSELWPVTVDGYGRPVLNKTV